MNLRNIHPMSYLLVSQHAAQVGTMATVVFFKKLCRMLKGQLNR